MIDAARDFGEQISGIGISKGCSLIDGISCGLAEWAVCVVSEPARDSLTSVELGLSVRKGRADAYG